MDNNKSILFVENFKLDKDNAMSTLYVQKCNKIKEINGLDWVDINDISNLSKKKYDVLLLGARSLPFYKCNNKQVEAKIWENMEKLLNGEVYQFEKKLVILQDMHPKTYGSLDNLSNFINQNKIDIIFTFYQCFESKIIRKRCPNSKYYSLVHHINTDIFKKYSEITKEYDVVLYGDVHPKHYPFRKRLFDLILKQKDIKTLHVIPPENRVFDQNKCEHGLARLINSGYLAIATKSRYDYFVAKYLEIAACDTVIFGDMATDGLDIFNSNYIRVDNSMSDDEILLILRKAIKERGEFLEFNKKVREEYNLDKYVENLIKIIGS